MTMPRDGCEDDGNGFIEIPGVGRFMIVSSSGRPVGGDGPLGSILGALLGDVLDYLGGSQGYNMASAHFNFEPLQFMPRETAVRLYTSLKAVNALREQLNYVGRFDARTRRLVEKAERDTPQYLEGLVTDYPTAIREMLASETTLALDGNAVSLYIDCTRHAIGQVLEYIVGQNRDRGQSKKRMVAIPQPNWHFASDEGGVPGIGDGRFPAAFFDAVDEATYVDNFEALARRDGKRIAALIISEPSVPLMMKLSEAAAKRIDDIAQRYGIQVIVDDVLRGSQPIGQRDTVARYFARPIIVEGNSKRFGDGLWGNCYILHPADMAITTNAIPLENMIYAAATDAMMRHASVPAQQEYERRNALMDERLRLSCPDVVATRPSSSNITTLVRLPFARPDGMTFTDYLHRNGVTVAPMEGFFHDYHAPKGLRPYIRVTCGRLDMDDLGQAMDIVCESINDAQRYSRRR
jgi:aspartate/methionine/tyrosine aminotransferase